MRLSVEMVVFSVRGSVSVALILGYFRIIIY